jgi:molybdate transport system substrate-binding protein
MPWPPISRPKPGNTVTISYAGSNALAKQIIEGAPADIFISAAVELDGRGGEGRAGRAGQPRGPAGQHAGAGRAWQGCRPGRDRAEGFDLKALLGDGKLSMAMVDSVPAGQYGKESLESLGPLVGGAKAAVAQAENVRAALALVSTGEAPYGIVYASDAVADENVTVVGTFPADSHKAIVYPAALLTGAAAGRRPTRPSSRHCRRTRRMPSSPHRALPS